MVTSASAETRRSTYVVHIDKSLMPKDVRIAMLDTTHTTEFLHLNPLTELWPASDYGTDVIIGAIDCGVWPESTSLKDDGMTKIPSRYFNKGVVASNPDVAIKIMNSTRDTEGHGTHTSSTVAGNYVKGASFFGYATGTARGVAPRARVAMYKVSWGFDGTYASDVIAGMDQAVADGVDIISISMGFNRVPLYAEPIAIASFGAMENGVLVSSSAGNDGPGFRTLHNGVPWGLTVAAGSIDRSFGGTLTLGNGLAIPGWTMFPARALVDDLPLIYNKTISACSSPGLLATAPYGIIICDDNSGSPFSAQVYAVTSSKVAAAIFVSEFLFYTLYYPGVVISPKDALALISYVERHA
ncbi:hypothetical protein RJ639_013881 [Escallonia herrerae]|uniref:Peptidase S8/S53 domain-containing protein n=1 Tax=Escallonia herrerae TaxID=1293975 RepID=A0AA88VFD3_9ASTE|nr:hypothetical protein RJ639_013881 [Escallonia herrerae]